MAIQNFIFGGDAIAKTPEELAKQRAVIQALQANSRAPRNVGEGLNALGDGIVANVLNRRANRAQTEGRESAAGVMEGIFGGMGGGSSPQVPAPASSPFAGGNISEPASPSAGGGNYRDAIASIESDGSGGYAAVGPTHDKLGRALGRYQVMEANIGPWSKEALGREVSADEFMANPALQDAVFDHRFGQYVEKFGPEGAAQAWFGGEGGVGKLGRKDSLGTSIAAYSDKFNNALGSAPQGGAQQAIEQALNGPQVASLDASAGMQPTQLPPITATATEPMALQQPTAQQGANVPINEIPSLMTGSQIAQAAPQAPAGFPMEEMAGMDPKFLGGPSAPRPSVAQALSGPQGAPQQGQQPQQGGQPSIQQLMQASANPWLSDSERQIVDALLQREMQNADPMRKLEMERAQLEIEQMRNPEPQMTAEQQNLQWRASQAGLQPGTPEYNSFMLSGGREGTTVNVDTGTIPQNYQAVRDDQGRLVRYEPIPGSPADTSSSDAASAENRDTSTGIITNAAKLAREALSAPGLPATGTAGRLLANLPESNAAEVRRQVATLQANAKIENLQAMRAASPTGGALGAVSDSENAMLAAKSGALDPDSPNFARDLDDYERTLLRIVHGQRVGDAIFEDTRAANKPISEMTDEELEALANGD